MTIMPDGMISKEQRIAVVVKPNDQGPKAGPFTKDKFRFDPHRDEYVCPIRKRLDLPLDQRANPSSAILDYERQRAVAERARIL